MRLNIAVVLLLCCGPVAVSAQTAQQEKTINLPAGISVEAASISRTGNLIATICSDHVVRVWSARSGELLRSLDENREPPSALQFSGDGRLLGVAYEIVGYEKGVIKVFDTDSWKVQHAFADSLPMYSLTFSPDGLRLAGAGDFDTNVWELASRKKAATISPPFGSSSSISFSPDGRWLASADGDAFVRVHDANSGSMRSATKDFLLEPMAVAFAPDGKSILAGGADKTISIIDPESGKVTRAFPKQPGLVWLLDVSADGKQAAAVYRSAERFLDINQLALWDLAKGTAIADFQKPGVTIVGGAFVGDHYLFTAASGNELTVWSIQ
ncbi:MAG TPA: hypothetical protein VF953_09860 [Terriglobales bacterium]|jgi:WD40 repeat protein